MGAAILDFSDGLIFLFNTTKIQDGRAHELPVQNSALVATFVLFYTL